MVVAVLLDEFVQAVSNEKEQVDAGLRLACARKALLVRSTAPRYQDQVSPCGLQKEERRRQARAQELHKGVIDPVTRSLVEYEVLTLLTRHLDCIEACAAPRLPWTVIDARTRARACTSRAVVSRWYHTRSILCPDAPASPQRLPPAQSPHNRLHNARTMTT